jgi:hypothetical protein
LYHLSEFVYPSICNHGKFQRHACIQNILRNILSLPLCNKLRQKTRSTYSCNSSLQSKLYKQQKVHSSQGIFTTNTKALKLSASLNKGVRTLTQNYHEVSQLQDGQQIYLWASKENALICHQKVTMFHIVLEKKNGNSIPTSNQLK